MKIALITLFLSIFLPSLFAQSQKQLLENAQRTNKSKSWNDLAEYYLNEEDSVHLKQCLEKSYQLALHEHNDEQIGRSLIYKGEYDRMVHQKYTDTYLALKQEAFKYLIKCPQSNYLSDYYIDISKLYNTKGVYDSALVNLFKAEKELIKHKSNKVGRIYCDIGYAYLYKGIPDSVRHYTQKAINNAIAGKDTISLITSYSLLGIVNRRENNYPKALDYYTKAAQLYEQQAKWKQLVTTWCNIAVLYTDWKKHDKAIEFAYKAINIAHEKHLSNDALSRAYLILGKPLRGIRQPRKAIDMYKKALPYLEIDNLKSACLFGLTSTYYELNMRDSADYYMLQLEVMYSQSQSLKTNSYYYYKGKISMNDNRYDEAIDYYEKGINLERKKQGAVEIESVDIYRNLSLAYEMGPKNYQKALYYRNMAFNLQDSIYQKSHNELMSDYYARFQAAEKELEIAHLQTEQKELHYKNLLLIGGCIIAVTLLIGALLYIHILRLKKEKEKAIISQRMEQKEAEFLTLQNDMEQRLTRKYINGLETERQRLASELHDDVCNSLLALEMSVRANLKNTDELPHHVNELAEISRRIRNVSHELMPPVFQYASIDEMLYDYLMHLKPSLGTQISYHSTEDINWNLIPREIGFEFYRIVQEAVNNAVKYADASCIIVNLLLNQQSLSMTITDDGKGFDTNKKVRGIGLNTIAQRVSTINASLNLVSEIGKGTRIEISVLLPAL